MTMQPNFISASTLTGDDVVNVQGESLGNLKDIMLDTSSGKIGWRQKESGAEREQGSSQGRAWLRQGSLAELCRSDIWPHPE